ncbi:MAG: GNAT family N-acetyltransferase [Deltaproteobacteria bacterium]|nr:GNAT family N-acetyltransferase [Deltaproteobacteria bacterium]MBI3389185.1 GNAT family N-acetyltransferase [Deltaproteobacteria bacterium]
MGTDRFALTVLSARDIPDLYAHFSQPEVTEFLDIGPLQSLEDAASIVIWAESLLRDARGVRWSIRERESGEFLGTCGFNTLVRERGSRAEVAYDLRAKVWGKGIMHEVLSTVVPVGLSSLMVHRIEAFVTPGNHRSERLLTKLGFHLEGHLRAYAYWKGRFWDQRLYSLLASDWQSPNAA